MTAMGTGTLVWLAGWGSTPAVWQARRQYLARYQHLDFNYQNCNWLSQLQQLQQRPDVVAVVGWSLGGLIALLAQQRQLLHLPCIVLNSTPAFCAAWDPRILKRMQKRLHQQPETVLQDFLAQMQLSYSPDIWQHWSLDSLSQGLDWLIQHDLRADLPTQHPQRYWIHSPDDQICPAHIAQPYVQHWLPNSGHASMLSQSAACYRAMAQYLEQHLTSPPSQPC